MSWIILVAMAGLVPAGQASALATARKRPADCIAIERNKPTLDAKRLSSARFRMVTDPVGWERLRSGEQVQLTLRHGEDTADLGSGMKLRIVQGGCESYSNLYEFTFPRSLDVGTDGVAWLTKVSHLLKELSPRNLDKLIPLSQLAEELARLAEDPDKAREAMSAAGLESKLGADELSPSYTFSVERRDGQSVVKVGYYIPL